MSADEKLNVLLIISDQHHRKVCGFAGNRRIRTPNIDRIAAQGVRFEHAYCQEPICGPSRTSLLTGTHPHTCNAFSHHSSCVLPEHLPTLGSVFREAGYRTGAIGKVHVRGEDKTRRDLGFDDRALRYYTYDMRDYKDMIGEENVKLYAAYGVGAAGKYNPKNEPSPLAEELMYDHLVTNLCLEFLEKNRANPFFLWMGLEKPHPQWYAPRQFHEMYDPADMELPRTRLGEHRDLPKRYLNRVQNGGSAKLIRNSPELELRRMMAAYYANVSAMDAQVGRALTALERLGLRERTIVIYTSDHGENLMEHALFQKHGMYEAAVGVPLAIACPKKIDAGLRKRSIVQLVDLFPTLMELTGIAAPAGLEGRSFAGLLRGAEEDFSREAFSEYYPAGKPAERMIRSGPWKYVYSHGDLEQLYNHETDPDELENLAVKPEFRSRCDAFKARVFDGWEIDAFDYVGEGAS
jgi:choline-sulfatase